MGLLSLSSAHVRLRKILRMSCVLTATVFCLAGCDQAQTPPPVSSDSGSNASGLFSEVSSEVGLVFQHYSGAAGRWHVPEILGSGVALIDYDADGDLDVFFVQASNLFGDDDAELFPLPANQPRGHRMFENRLIPDGALTFNDVTTSVGLADQNYGMGVAVADYDNDGDADLYVAGFGNNAFYQNNNGIFKKLENAAGAQDTRWSTSASFCDVNNDQLPDLYVTNYIHYERTNQVVCRDALGQQDYCGPKAYTGAPDALFINNGQGQFVDRSDKWGLTSAASTGLGVVCRDLNQDGTNDVYVANDAMPNLLWLNRNNNGFEEQAQLMGAAINVNGMSEGSMGIAAGDYDRDGDDDLFITHWDNETNTLYRNDLELGFIDVTSQANLATPSLSHTGFGTQWLDIENDGDLDLFVANGAVQRYIDGTGVLSKSYGQKNQVFLNDGTNRFTNARTSAGAATESESTGRGAAFGDIDNDGDTDVVVTNKDARARLYLNNVGQLNTWLGVQLQGTRSSKDAYGAVVSLELMPKITLRRVVNTDGSYQSASDPRVVFGLGSDTNAQTITVRWPSGKTQQFSGLVPGSYHFLVEE